MRIRLVHAVLQSLLLLAVAPPLAARGFPAACAGTYLIQEAGGARDFWTLAADGTFFGTTSTQPLFNFSNQQGSWSKDGSEGAKGVLLAFVFDGNNELASVARIDIALHTLGDGCDTVAGALEVRLFDPGDDPLGPGAGNLPPAFTDTFTGRRVR